jgi:hypothetical protein
MDCKTARTLMDFAHPRMGELDAAESKALEAHLQECPECGPLAYFEQQLDEHLGRAMRDLSVPADLRDRLQARLKIARGVLYRRRAIGLAAAAALLLVTTLGAWYWLTSNRPAMSPEVLVAERSELPGTAEELEVWYYQKFGVKILLPRDLNYAYLADCYRAELKGRLVPRLRFVREQSVADVIVLSFRKFDLEPARNVPRAGSGALTVEFRFDQNNPDVAYLIEFTGPSFEWLVKDQSGTL